MLILDAHLRASLAIIRSLGKKNIHVTAGSEIKSAMGLYSKYCHKKIRLSNPRKYPKIFLEELLAIVEKNHYDCLFPTQTYTTFLLSKYKEIFSQATTIPLPDFETFSTVYDKKNLFTIASQQGISCPKTYFSTTIDEIIDDIIYPVVVKASRRHGVGIQICTSSTDLCKKYAVLHNYF